MNLKKRLRHIADIINNPRAYGKTSLLSKITKELDGVLIVHNTDEVTRLRRLGVTAKSMDTNFDGLSGPFFIDNQAVMRLLTRAAEKIEALEVEIEFLKKEVSDLSPVIGLEKRSQRVSYEDFED
jgi:hypothetical protein